MRRTLSLLCLMLAAGGPIAAQAPEGDTGAAEPRLLQLFAVEHASAREIAYLLNHGLEPDGVVVGGGGRLVAVRGTAAKIEAAAALIRDLDRPPAEVALEIEVLVFDDASRSAVDDLLGRRTRRLTTDQRTRLRDAGRGLAAPGLSTFDRGRAGWQLMQELVVDAGGEVAAIEGGLALVLRPRVHAGGEVTLEVATTWTDFAERPEEPAADPPELPEVAPPPAPPPTDDTAWEDEAARERVRERLRERLKGLKAESSVSEDSGQSREAPRVGLRATRLAGEWQARLAPGETLLVNGVLPAAARRKVIAAALLGNAVDGAVVLLVTPRVTRAGELPKSDFEIICAGVDVEIDLCDDASRKEP